MHSLIMQMFFRLGHDRVTSIDKYSSPSRNSAVDDWPKYLDLSDEM